MSSTNEEMPAQPKPKVSHLEFRNTDLVSRLLAATPPYLYNMPLVPHSYFFSEMLRSLVQGKAEAAARMPVSVPHRRSRKRSWSHGRSDHYSPKQMSPNAKCDSAEMPPPNWTPKLVPEKQELDHKAMLESPLELTMNKIPLNNNTKICHSDNTMAADIMSNSELGSHKTPPGVVLPPDKPELHPNVSGSGHVPLMFPPLPNISPQDSSPGSSDLILPPPPPIWYPPLYPTPYGIDPLHFFIDLRVSGHIYDRKNSKEHPNLNMNIPHPPGQQQLNHLPIGNPLGHVLDMNSTNTNSTVTSSSALSENINNFNGTRESLVRQPRHPSAFSVPTPSLTRNDPLNLSGNKYHSQQRLFKYADEKPAKFDIKSMGFDTNTASSKSTNYILKNLSRIYKDVHGTRYKEEGIDLTSPKYESEQKAAQVEEVNVKDETSENKEDDKENDKEKRCKDLRALIGLELVVDYVKHEVKPGTKCHSEPSNTDIESSASSPAVEIVSLPNLDSAI